MSQTAPPPADLAAELAHYGDVEAVALPRMQKLTAAHVSRNWTNIPHVTHHDHADVTELEQVRLSWTDSAGARISALPIYLKAVAIALREFPKFSASLDVPGGSIVLKKYCHIGFAIDTPRGLLVAVVRNCDRKSVAELGAEVSSLVAQARQKGLPLSSMVGGCFTISSLGRNGGLSFTPIINGNEVAILGISRLVDVPARDGDHIVWRTHLPLSLSYDHRIINGADASSFMTFLRRLLTTPSALLTGLLPEADVR